MTLNLFSENLKAVRKSKHLTQMDLANRLGLSKGTVSAYEQNLSHPSVETLVKICNVLDTSADFLLGMSNDLPFRMGGLTDEQMESVLQFVSLIERANAVLDKDNDILD